jgi:phage tail sheath gpL-like
MNFAFNEIPLTLRTPGIFAEFDSSRAVQGVASQPHDSLLIGQKTSGGSAVAGAIHLVGSADEAIALFGSKSQLAQMCAAYKEVDKLTPLYAIALSDNGAGVPAAGSITVAGTATEAGEALLYIGGRRVSVAVPNGMTATEFETAALAALALQTDLPVSVAASSGTGVDLTAVNDGTQGNQIMLGVCLGPGERAPAGFTFTVTAMASGATDTDYATAVTAMGEDQYHTVAVGCADNTNLGLVDTEMKSRMNAMRAIEGIAFQCTYDTAGNLTTKGNAFNSPVLVIVGGEKSAYMRLPWEIAAQSAAISALQAQIDPARSMQGKAYVNAYAAPRGSRFTRAQRDVLLSDGISTLKPSSDGRLTLERAITTYQTNALSIADTAYMDVYCVRTLFAIRYSVRVRVGTKFGGWKLGDDGATGANILTPSILKGELKALFLDWRDLGWVENYDQFVEELLVARDGSDPNRINVILPPDIINAFLVGAFQIQFKR